MPADHLKEEFYGDLFDLWFLQVPTNAKYQKLDEIRETFLEGGYYRFDISDKLSVISLNSIYFSVKNLVDLDGAWKQLHWLKNKLKNSSPDHKFILQMHVFYGLNFYWEEDY